ncbi:MAG: S9 family peptidase [Clostridia bacterium]
MNKRQFKTEDFMKFKFVNDPQLSPDNKQIMYVLSTSEKEKYLSNLWLYNLESQSEKQFTFGDSDKLPRFSPDGQTIAFVSKRSGKNQLYTMPMNGGEPTPIVEFRYGVKEFAWSPDGKKIAFTANCLEGQTVDDLVKLKEDQRDKDIKEQHDTFRKITNMKYKMNGLPGAGLIGEKNTKIFVVDVNSQDIQKITDGDRDDSTPIWNPNNKGLVFSSNREDNYDQEPRIRDLYFINLEDKKLKKLTDSDGSFSSPQYSNDGKWLAFYGNKGECGSATNNTLYLINTVNGEMKDLLPNLDQSVGITAAMDMKLNAPTPGPIFTEDNQHIYITSSYHGSTHFYKVTRANGEINQITKGFFQVNNYCINKKEAAVMYSGELFPNDLAIVNLENGDVKRLTEVNKDLLEECFVSEPEEFWYESFDGTKIQGWVQKPYGFKEGEKYPLIINVHGGPHSMFTPSFFFEFQIMNSEGYVLLFINPRGSQGYGQEFTDAVRGDYGGGDFKDIMSAFDYAETLPYVDKENVGITGGSYGGFMTNWAVGNTNRFKAGVTLRSISNWVSFYGVSDIGYTFGESEVGCTPWGNIAKMWDHSPLKYVEKVNTPLLIIHSEEDIRCPIEQADQFYIFLKRLEKEVEYLRFPEENHELSRSGMPKRRVARLDAIKNWFNDHLERN